MNYIKVTTNDIANGNGIRVVLWVSGCQHHCPQCHNPQTWDSNAGYKFTDNVLKDICQSLNKDYISGITYSGGDPLHIQNREDIKDISKYIKNKFPNKTQWLYTGYTWGEIKNIDTIQNIDVLVDGKFEIENKDISLKFRGSSNQHLIDVQKSLQEGKVILWE